MGLIHEEIKHPNYHDIELDVVQKEKGELSDDWEIIHLNFPLIHSYSPEDLISISNWLIEQANRIKKQYTKTGKLKKPNNNE